MMRSLAFRLFPLRCVVCEARPVDARRDAPACAACWDATILFAGDEALCTGDVRAASLFVTPEAL